MQLLRKKAGTKITHKGNKQHVYNIFLQVDIAQKTTFYNIKYIKHRLPECIAAKIDGCKVNSHIVSH